VIIDEDLSARAEALGQIFRERCSTLLRKHAWVETVRGRGLLNAIVIAKEHPVTALTICHRLADAGLLAKPTHDTIIRFAPPLVISEGELHSAIDLILRVFDQCAKL
ncbi:pyridoxal phosphate-dependent transferase, partial [Pavlovales sp. CCMP2436]